MDFPLIDLLDDGDAAQRGHWHSAYQRTEYTWDYRNRLVRVVVKDAAGTVLHEERYTSDVLDRRIGVWEDVDGAGPQAPSQRWTVYDGDNPWADFAGDGSLTTRYLYGLAIDQLFARLSAAGEVDWYLTDHLGSVRQIVASDGTVRDEITYDSFGQVVRETNPSAGDRFKYTGREWHAALDQYYYRARYYDPGVGRFLGEAPLRFRAGDSNLYRYVFNSPTNYTDPSGKALPLILIIGGAAVIGILAVPNVANAPGPGEPHFGRPDPFLQQGVVGWKAMRKICLLLAGAGALLGMVGEGDVPNGGQDIGPVDPPDRFIVDRDLAQAYRALEEALRDLRNTNPWEHPEEWAEIMEKVQRLRQQIDDWPR